MQEIADNRSQPQQPSGIKKYTTPINIALVCSFLVGLFCLILPTTGTELFLLGKFVSTDIFVFATVLFWGLLYLKWVLSRYQKTRKVFTLLVWLMPPILAFFSIIALFVRNSILLSVLPTTFVFVALLCCTKTPWKQMCLTVLSYWGLCAALAMPLAMTLFFVPYLNTDYEIYEYEGTTYVQSTGGFMAAEWTVVYEMSSPVTMVEVQD